MSDTSVTEVRPSAVIPEVDTTLDQALARFTQTSNCPSYVTSAYIDWKANLG